MQTDGFVRGPITEGPTGAAELLPRLNRKVVFQNDRHQNLDIEQTLPKIEEFLLLLDVYMDGPFNESFHYLTRALFVQPEQT